MLTWHVVMHKVEGRAAAYFIADKDSTGAHQAWVVGHTPPHVYCLLPTGQQTLRGAHLQYEGGLSCARTLQGWGEGQEVLEGEGVARQGLQGRGSLQGPCREGGKGRGFLKGWG